MQPPPSEPRICLLSQSAYFKSLPPPLPLSSSIASFNVNPQTQSPLFGVLYPELRNLIFVFALTAYDDRSRPYSKHSCYYRPGFEYPTRIATDLLLSCRLIYLETHLAPVSLNEHAFCMERGPHNYIRDHTRYFEKMTVEQRAAVKQVRFYTQLYWLEGRMKQEWPVGLSIPKLVITVRHSDWWFWENSEPLRIDDPDQWGAWVGSIPGLRELEIEFETIDAKKEELEERVRVALGWKFPLKDGACLIHNGEEPVKSTWLGSSYMSPDNYEYDDSDYSDDDIAAVDYEGSRDLKFSMTLVHHVRKFQFVVESRVGAL
ncbi:hypothetical protein R3P38DRAFT_2495918 [Favolaschia claudopus]|uniref:Uncharacterized protein n=1 Tax=Favolaschia claudopus TaxID=2862362 RepID=A0AAW0E6V8_9AGAR